MCHNIVTLTYRLHAPCKWTMATPLAVAPPAHKLHSPRVSEVGKRPCMRVASMAFVTFELRHPTGVALFGTVTVGYGVM